MQCISMKPHSRAALFDSNLAINELSGYGYVGNMWPGDESLFLSKTLNINMSKL